MATRSGEFELDGGQPSFDFGAWGIAARAIERAMEQCRQTRTCVKAEIAKAVEAARSARIARMRRQKVRVYLSTYDLQMLIFDGSRIYERREDGSWICQRKTWMNPNCPWLALEPADLGNVEVERLVQEVRRGMEWLIVTDLELRQSTGRGLTVVSPVILKTPAQMAPEHWFDRSHIMRAGSAPAR